jgi:hypothetical protein
MVILFLGMIAMILAVCRYGNTDSLLMLPLTSPDEFLTRMPHTIVKLFGADFVLIQPSSTFFVYLLGAVMILVGGFFLVTSRAQRSRIYWAVGLILWGLGAIAAGTSYQAFGYELKCRGREYCLFTSDFELVYMLLTAYSINFLVASTGYTSLNGKGRNRLIYFALIDSAAYSVFLLVGALLPVKFLVSYEGFMAFIGVNFVLMFVLNVRHSIRYQDVLNRNLVFIWIGFLLVNAFYFVSLFGELGAGLYQNLGIWFNENDVLHVLLILWAFMIYALLKNRTADIPGFL